MVKGSLWSWSGFYPQSIMSQRGVLGHFPYPTDDSQTHWSNLCFSAWNVALNKLCNFSGLHFLMGKTNSRSHYEDYLSYVMKHARAVPDTKQVLKYKQQD